VRALTLHARDALPILAILVVVVLPAAMYLLQVSRVRRARLAGERTPPPQTPGRIRILATADLLAQSRADLATVVRTCLSEALGPAGDHWEVTYAPPPATQPLVTVEITAAQGTGNAATTLAATLRARLAENLPVTAADIDLRLTPTPA
jgi:hypothetical protein